jgi:Cytochrome bd terminal oxidase subunit I
MGSSATVSVVLTSLAAAAEAPAELLPARTQMGFTLGVHIILVPLGVVFPLMMLIANYLGLRRNDADYMRLAERWSKVAAVTFAVGAVQDLRRPGGEKSSQADPMEASQRRTPVGSAACIPSHVRRALDYLYASLMNSHPLSPTDPMPLLAAGADAHGARVPDLERHRGVGDRTRRQRPWHRARQKTAIGLTGDPVPPAIRSGAAMNRNSQRSASSHRATRSSNCR